MHCHLQEIRLDIATPYWRICMGKVATTQASVLALVMQVPYTIVCCQAAVLNLAAPERLRYEPD